MNPYPLFLVGLERRACYVVGGDEEAERKARGLLEREARVTVIAPDAVPGLHELARLGRLRLIERRYRDGDLADAFLVIATPACDATVREEVYRESERVRALVNVMDDPPRCSFVAGSVVRRGPLQVAISTAGAAPALAVRLRERFERELGEEYGVLLSWLEARRERMKSVYPDWDRRRAAWYRIVDSDLLERLREGRVESARRRLDELVAGAGEG